MKNELVATEEQISTEPNDDFILSGGGSVYLLRPMTKFGVEWVEQNISQAGFQPYWPEQVVIEHRYVRDLIEGIRADGLTVRG